MLTLFASFEPLLNTITSFFVTFKSVIDESIVFPTLSPGLIKLNTSDFEFN